MLKLEKISPLQLLFLIIINRFLFGFSFMPTVTIAPANQDAWIADLISGVLIILFAIPLLIMASTFKEMSFDEYYEIILGKPIGKIINTLYALYLTFIVLLTVVFLSDFLLSSVFPETPMYAILAVMILPCIYASYKGIECIGRAAVIMGIFVFAIILLYAVANANNMDLKVFLPVVSDSSLSNLAFGAFNNATRFCDCFVFFLFVPYALKNKKQSIVKLLILLVIAFTLANTILTVVTQGVLSTEYAKTLRYPYYISIQQISLFDIIQRIEFFNIIGWIIIFFFKIASTILAVSIIMARILKVNSYKPFIIPINAMIVVSVLFTGISNYAVFRKIIVEYAYLVIFTANFVIPTIILCVYFARKSKLKACKAH